MPFPARPAPLVTGGAGLRSGASSFSRDGSPWDDRAAPARICRKAGASNGDRPAVGRKEGRRAHDLGPAGTEHKPFGSKGLGQDARTATGYALPSRVPACRMAYGVLSFVTCSSIALFRQR